MIKNIIIAFLVGVIISNTWANAGYFTSVMANSGLDHKLDIINAKLDWVVNHMKGGTK